jgi:ketosteroid isomerase-like protein
MSAMRCRLPTLLLLLLPASCVFARGAPEAETRPAAARAAVAATLDDFHAAASQADGTRYFGHFAQGAVFLGTDASERWSVDAFRAYAEPYFSRGQGWTYVPTARHVQLANDGRVAWFDERLHNDKYGEVRGSGVLVLRHGRWLIAQYNLAFPVPNDLVEDLVAEIAAHEAAHEAAHDVGHDVGHDG